MLRYVKKIVLEKGLENFYDSKQEIFDKILEEIISIFDHKIETSSQIIKKAILILENIIEQHEELNNRFQKVEQIKNDINKVLVNV